MSPKSVLDPRHSQLNLFVRLPQLFLPTASLFEIDNQISLSQDLLLSFPRPHILRPECLSTLAWARLARYQFSDECKDLDKSISHSTEAVFLPFDAELGSCVIDALSCLAIALLRSREVKQLGDMKHAIGFLRYLRDQSLETSNLSRNQIKSVLVKALADQVKLESLDPMQGIGEMATLCRELLRSGVEESLLINTVKELAGIIYETAVPGQLPSEGVIECLREARIRLPNLKMVFIALAALLHVRFSWTHSQDDPKEALSILDELIADPNEDVGLAMKLAKRIAHSRFFFDSKPEYLAEAIFRTRTLLDAMPSEHPDHRSVMDELAYLEKTRFEEFGVRSGRQEDIAGVVNDSHLAAWLKMAKLNLMHMRLPSHSCKNLSPSLLPSRFNISVL